MKFLPLSLALTTLGLFLGLCSCSVQKEIGETKAATALNAPPCQFEGGRLMLDWEQVYNISRLKFPEEKLANFPPQYAAFRINDPALTSFMANLDHIPYDKRTIVLPVADGASCLSFQLEPVVSSTTPNGDYISWTGYNLKDTTASLQMVFKNNQLEASIRYDGKSEQLTGVKDESGILYYFLFAN